MEAVLQGNRQALPGIQHRFSYSVNKNNVYRYPYEKHDNYTTYDDAN